MLAALAKSRRYKGKRRRRWNCASRLRFPGQYYDQESGLHYNYFRDYDPSTGRYIESDPIGLNGGVSLYAYVSGSPLGLIDRLGLWETTVTAYCRQHPAECTEASGAAGRGAGAAGGSAAAAASLLPGDSSQSTSNERSRAIPWPDKPKSGCTAVCRADCNDLKPGNCPEDPNLRFQFGTATASFCGDAVIEAARAANKALGCQAKHTQCKCTDRSGLQYNCKTG
ncbi:RHS repeat-associated core domain-containing protein [Pseudomarimonas arenosa]|uniref:RHS repeat-associated core domain-containing protein n=1 Tax=Pseudomarimonas arenosa TaxID=2774145 RepID=UPI003CCCE448